MNDFKVYNKESVKILVLGCGNSTLSEEMYDSGHKLITNNDISKLCIERMKKRNENIRPNMKWDVMDIRDMSSYKDELFDIIVDKGTIDAILCGKDPHLNAAIMLSECQRILKTGGVYVAISFGLPPNREFHF